MNAPTYPIFVLEKDDFSFREVAFVGELDWYEWPDIAEGLYEGWDSSGRHFTLVWNSASGTREIVLDDQPSVTAFWQAVEKYAERFGKLSKKPRGLCEPSALAEKVDEIARQTGSDNQCG